MEAAPTKGTPPSSTSITKNPYGSSDVSGSDLVSGVIPTIIDGDGRVEQRFANSDGKKSKNDVRRKYTIVLNDSPTQGGGEEEDTTYIVVKRQNIAIRARKKEVVNKKKAKANEDSDEEFRDDEIHVYFHDKEVASAKIIKHYIDTVKNSGVLRAILVSQVMKLSAAAKKSIDKKNAQYFHFELFEEKELIANITEHHLVPKHKVLSTEEKQELLDRYTSHETQLPRMLITDPISRYYGLTRGQVVKITRKSDTAGEYETYRIVV
ncbi:hypothetical protein IFM89_015470 [Coptis chinensis]|uniref:RNA polymerase subunit H/Rpb5 C-terminal domain-containing protein n=1 Tax=Coptis chinensis TaxID=261450 RepID=A0A835IAZ5_9MAGN|nr:hypothetical protein IFM89_015470 [Coptis chinensis]